MSRDETRNRRQPDEPRLLQLKQYEANITEVTAEETGRLTRGEGEPPAAGQRSLDSASRALGVPLTVKRVCKRVSGDRR